MLHYISCNTMHPNYGAIPVPNVPVRSYLHEVLWSHIDILMRLLAAGPRRTTGLLLPSWYLRRTISSLKQYLFTFHSTYDCFVLLEAFNTNTLTFHQCFKDKLSSHQPSHMHNTRHRTNSNFNTPLFNHSKTQKCYLYQVIPIWSSLPS